MINFSTPHIYFGPNLFSPKPVVAIQITEIENNVNIRKAAERMNGFFRSWWPGVNPQQGESNEFFIAKYFAQWISDALNSRHGVITDHGAKEIDGDVYLYVNYHEPKTIINSLNLAASLFLKFSNNNIDEPSERIRLQKFWQQIQINLPDFQAEILMNAANQLNIPYLPFISGSRTWQFGWGNRALKFFESSSQEDSSLGYQFASNKSVSKTYLQMLGAPCAPHIMVDTQQQNYLNQVVNFVKQHGFPCVIKPDDRGRSQGVSVNLQSMPQIRQAIAEAQSKTRKPIMLEKFIPGEVHRILVIRGKVWGVSKRVPAFVVGDGQRTIKQLLDSFNSERKQANQGLAYMGTVPLDDLLIQLLKKQNTQLDAIPQNGEKIRLREIPLQSTGAQNYDVSEQLHPDTKQMAEMIAESLSLNMLGIDFITPDIAESCFETGAFIEINLTPSLRGHLIDGKDKNQVAKAVLGDKPSRLPTLLVILDENQPFKEAFNKEVSEYKAAGWCYAREMGVGSLNIPSNSTLPSNIKKLLINPKVEKIVCVITTQQLEKFGMPFFADQCAVLTNKLTPQWLSVIEENSTKNALNASVKETSKILKTFLDKS